MNKIFNGKLIKIRGLSSRDLKNVRKFQDFINSLVEEKVQILVNKKLSLKEETQWLKKELKEMKDRKRVSFVAEDKDLIVGIAEIYSGQGRQSQSLSD